MRLTRLSCPGWKNRYRSLLTSGVADPDPHQIDRSDPDPDPDQHQSDEPDSDPHGSGSASVSR